MQDRSALGRIMEVVRDLRLRCSWDRVQTRATLRPYLVEEVLELDYALGQGDAAAIRDETGDLLLHLAWQLVLAEELGEFTPDEIAGLVEGKMQRRHPHLFDLGPAEPWERVKHKERRSGALDGLPPGLPALLAAYRLQERAASVGFDWPDAAGPLAKVREETDEVAAELAGGRTEALPDEIGDLLFAVVNLARKAGIEPGSALERANRKFVDRFRQVERLAAERGLAMESAGLEALDRLWDEVKRDPRAVSPSPASGPGSR
jgi:ATP diphosphatase